MDSRTLSLEKIVCQHPHLLTGLSCPSLDDEEEQPSSREAPTMINQPSLDRQSGKHLIISQYIHSPTNVPWLSLLPS